MRGLILNSNMSKRNGLLCLGAAVSAMLLTGLAAAQTIKDFPTLKGNSSRTGRNGDPINTGPGIFSLTWFVPNLLGGTQASRNAGFNIRPIIVDNTDFGSADLTYSPDFPYDTTYGFSALFGSWVPVAPNFGASPTYSPNIRNRTTAGHVPNYNTRTPAYLYSRCTASAVGQDPTVAAIPGERSYFEWTVDPKLAPADPTGGGPRKYALSAFIPDGGTPVGATKIFRQRYFVYEVTFGNLQRFVDIVDTNAAGHGWVRLGNGGLPTKALFEYNGLTPIKVRLYNTMPRNSAGLLPITDQSKASNYCVYADAAQALPSVGYYTATPTSMTVALNDIRVTAALNEVSTTTSTAGTGFVQKGVVTSYAYNTGTPIWRYSPAENSALTINVDNAAANGTAGFVSSIARGKFLGTDYQKAVIGGSTATDSITYAPTLSDGSYEIYAYLPGNGAGELYGTAVDVSVQEGATVTKYAVDHSAGNGWVKIGTRRFANSSLMPLKVTIFNSSAVVGDIGKYAFADSFRFVRDGNLTINASPVHTSARIRKANGTLAATNVVIIADENGRLHCLDAVGNSDGTTIEYWSYPSAARPLDPNYVDPNQGTLAVPGPDGFGPVAEMPTGFDLSTAVVQTIFGTREALFVTGTNGRIYSIDMTGRGDYDAPNRLPGTTSRRWTYPSDYPSTIVPSSLGRFRGSLAYVNLAAGPTIIAGTEQGRIYALGVNGNVANFTTNVRWQYPAANQPTLGPIRSTPTIEFGRVYFGTARNPRDDSAGVLYALNATNGGLVWQFSDGGTADDFLGSPITVPGTVLNTSPPGQAGNPDTVYASNQNRFIYALNAATGAGVWQTDELGTGSAGALTFTIASVLDNSGIRNPYPIILVPTDDGRFDGLYARASNVNRFGTRRAYEFIARDSIVASNSVSNNFAFGADMSGFLYAFSNTAGSFSGETPPGQETVVENDTRADLFRTAKVKLLTKPAYNALRLPTGSAGHLSYNQALSAGNSFTRNPLAFEWGETAYIMVYDFPYVVANASGEISPPTVNYSFSVEGQTSRSVPVEARQFTEPPNAPLNPIDNTKRQNGYAIYAFTFQGAGPNALPPGNGGVGISISTAALSASALTQNIALNPTLSKFLFKVSNPIAIAMLDPFTGTTSTDTSIGVSVNPGDPQSIVNGSPDLAVTTTNRENLLLASAGVANHGAAKAARLLVYDRSMMSTIRADGSGLDLIRIERRDLGWQGGVASIYKRLPTNLYPQFEDAPTGFPNISLDYPDIKAERVRATKDPDTNPENPLFNGVTLNAPVVKVGNTTRPLEDTDKPEDRTLVPTIFELAIDVPKFQPGNDLGNNVSQIIPNSAGSTSLPEGYLGRINVFVDTSGKGYLDITSREAYRGFNLSTAVAVDDRFSVTTPTVDLGSLAAGTGYAPVAAGTNYDPINQNPDSVYQPWAGNYANLFKTFHVINEGNVNAIDLRIAKSARLDLTKPVQPYIISSAANDDQAWFDPDLNLHSDMDRIFAPRNIQRSPIRGFIVLPKSRVEDQVPTELSPNLQRRANPFLNTTGYNKVNGLADVLDPTTVVNSSGQTVLLKPPGPPKIGVTVPIGFPAGKYVEKIRVIENSNNPNLFSIAPSETWNRLTATTVEAYSDPPLELGFNIRESRVTNSYTPGTVQMIDDLVPPAGFSYRNLQPSAMRDQFGGLVLAWASDRQDNSGNPIDTPLVGGPLEALTGKPTRLFLATVGNNTTFGQNTLTYPTVRPFNAPLRDLNEFSANGGAWFKKAPISATGFPAESTVSSLFALGADETIAPGTASFGRPAFPATGMMNPFLPTQKYSSAYMAFVGDAQRQTPTGRVLDSRIFLSSVTTTAGGGINSISTPVAVPYDTQSAKGKPAIVQTASGALLFFPATSGSSTGIYTSRFDPTLTGAPFTKVSALPFGDGFVSVASPSAAARAYSGADATLLGNIVDLTFTGKLRGRPVNEVFIGRLKLNGDRLPETATTELDGNPFVHLPQQFNERLVAEGDGLYRARGVDWSRGSSAQDQLTLTQTLAGQAATDLLLADTRVIDPETGLISYETRLGGKVVIDPALGTVRFTAGMPSRSAEVRLTYHPRFVRISAGAGVGYTGASGLFDFSWLAGVINANTDATDANNNSYYTYWKRAGSNTPVTTADAIRSERYLFTYTRGATGANQSARPFMSSMRFGIRLGYRLYTDKNGIPAPVTVTGNVGPYQISPTNGRIYFTSADEDRSGITVQFTGIDDSTGNAITNLSVTGSVSLVQETDEQPILIDEPTNESALTSFIDPVTYLTPLRKNRRPSLVWLFWTSTRTGSPDVYFETISPRFDPLPTGQ